MSATAQRPHGGASRGRPPRPAASPARSAGAPPRARWRLRLLWVGLALLALLAVGGYLVGWSPWLAVRQVEVVGERRVTEQQVLDAAAVRDGTPMLRLDTAAVVRRVMTLPQVASVQVERRWPGTLRIVVTEQRPVGYVTTGTGYGLVGGDGVVITTVSSRPAALPELDDLPGAGGGASAAALEAASALPSSLARRVAVVAAATADDVRLVLRSGAHVEWGSAQASGLKARVLAMLLRRPPARAYDVSSPQTPSLRR